MGTDTHQGKRHIEGSTGVHAAVPPRISDGGSGGAPLGKNAPSLLKPAVLATILPDLSHGTHGMAIHAVNHYPGAAPSRLRRRGGGMAFLHRLELVHEQLNREYLAVPMMALVYTLVVRYLQLIIRIVLLDRSKLFLAAALPCGAINSFVHDRKDALFRRRAVD